MKTLEEKIEVMQAALAGKEIEYFGSTKTWIIATCPCWDWEDFDYRIKPENKQVPYDFSDAESLIGRKCKTKSSKYLGIIVWVDGYGVHFEGRNFDYDSFSKLLEIWNNTLNRWESCTKTVKA